MIRWQQTITGFGSIGNATVDAARNVVYISTPPAAFDFTSGRRLWRSHIPGQAVGGAALDERRHTLYVGLYDPGTDTGSIAALNTTDGSLSWRADLGHDTLALLDRVWLDGERLIVPTQSGRVIALEPASGAQRWQYQPAPARFGAITVSTASGRIWLALQNGAVLALDTATGKPVARFSDITLNLTHYNLAQRPVIIGDKLIAALGVRLYGLNIPDK
jgi:outer membrane protein assembly factor BamB